ncbi:yajO [Mytilus edulis]|uniref:YajO n=1 Tax=Mytilus edulis TaxID=6550 RepID=A0A8S3RVM1_MYTED|nr:yajO [Mytilus edulis]
MSAVPRITIPGTDLNVSRICLGTNQFNDNKETNGRHSQKRYGSCSVSRAIVTKCLEVGINFFDTAEGYAGSEQVLGRALQGRRQEAIIATKFGFREGPNTPPYNAVQIDEAITKALTKLQTSYVDLLQSTGEPQHTISASQNQHTRAVNGVNESNHCISEESENRPSHISSEQLSDTIRDRPSQHDDIPRNGRNETNASCSNTSEIELSSTLTDQSSAATNTTTDISGGNQDENMHNGSESSQVQHEVVQSKHQSILQNNKTAEIPEHRPLAGYTSNDSSNDDTPLIKLTKNKLRLKKQDALRKSALKRLLNAKRYIYNVRDKRTNAGNMTPVPRKKLYHFRDELYKPSKKDLQSSDSDMTSERDSASEPESLSNIQLVKPKKRLRDKNWKRKEQSTIGDCSPPNNVRTPKTNKRKRSTAVTPRKQKTIKSCQENNYFERKKKRIKKYVKENVRQFNRVHGLSYIGLTGKEQTKKKMQYRDCSKCKFKCSVKITAQQAGDIFATYYQLGSYEKQRNFICQHVEQTKAKKDVPQIEKKIPTLIF